MPGRSAASRRTVLRGMALTPVAGLGLTACGGGEERPSQPAGPVGLGTEGEVAPGSSKPFRDHDIVVSRDGNGSFTAYSTLCTHASCPISQLEGTKPICPCHGSEFDATAGKGLREPAAPLTPLSVEVRNGTIVARPQT
ncbi:Rieske (2Fe-2S) protein [Streptomyces sp. KMM 9044]|uniref:Rieske (2Fe-2S) protein n=1 Tax=Streptomyces sp. KMM 9044 TaxID=2744474 RepID=UPI002151A3A6|nr:Rieske (2Fe-2S) protein [Streptomyces sp. KMM 9044]WAX82060.1 Rieske (2Fe-2S) protein [Streptomyces sp. KMM 9044]